MAAPDFQVLACNSLDGTRLGYLDLQGLTFNTPLAGVGTLAGNAILSPAQDADKLEVLTRTDDVALYVVSAGNVFWWGGVIKSRPWDPSNRLRAVTATSWKGWLGTRIIGPNAAVNPVTDVVYGYTATDQLAIARAIITAATADTGCPAISIGTETSGVLRDLNWLGSDFRYAADLIDSMASRAGGFDWEIQPSINAVTGLPVLTFVPYYPQRGNQSVALTFRKTPNGGNIIVDSPIDESSTERRTRVWTTGKGTPPDRKMAYDEDPDVDAGLALLTETVTNYSSVDTVATLATNARAERTFRGVPTNTMQIKALFADLDPTLYDTGDRIQLIYSDEGLSLNLPSVRIIDRALNPFPSDGAPYATITLDLSDTELPDNTAEV
jgi:hypothetical protein